MNGRAVAPRAPRRVEPPNVGYEHAVCEGAEETAMEIQVTETIERPRAEVFAAFSDLAGSAERIDGITALEVLTDGPFAPGTRWRETRLMFGKEATEEMEISAVDAPASYGFMARTQGTLYENRLDFAEVDEHTTRVTRTFRMTPEALSAKLLAPMVSVMVRTVGRKALVQDLADMKASLEQLGS
jgi:hypothetical protein